MTASEILRRARCRHTNAVLNVRSRERIGDMAELARAKRELVRAEHIARRVGALR